MSERDSICASEEKPEADCRDIPGFPGYSIDPYGNVWSRFVRKAIPGKRGQGKRIIGDTQILLNSTIKSNRYCSVTLYRDGKAFQQNVHVLVLESFIGPRPIGCVACHNNGDCRDNRLCNLRWDSQSSNEADKREHGTKPDGERNGSVVLTVSEVIAIRQLHDAGAPQRYLARKFKTSQSNIGMIVRGETWRHVPITITPLSESPSPQG